MMPLDHEQMVSQRTAEYLLQTFRLDDDLAAAEALLMPVLDESPFLEEEMPQVRIQTEKGHVPFFYFAADGDADPGFEMGVESMLAAEGKRQGAVGEEDSLFEYVQTAGVALEDALGEDRLA